MNLADLQKELHKHVDKEKAAHYATFFKSGPGQYGEGQQFLGITVPDQRKLAQKYKELSLKEIEKLLKSKWHEERLTALLLLVYKYKAANYEEKENIVTFYLENKAYVNNWDLVDSSAYQILGDFLCSKKKDILYTLAKSKNLWERRIAMLSCFAFIKINEFKDALEIAEILINDKHDLMHKAVGWMLREIGKKNLAIEEKFLKKHYKAMPRTMLRYAIERFEEKKRQAYLKGLA